MCILLGKWALAMLREMSRQPSSSSIFGQEEEQQLFSVAVVGARVFTDQHFCFS